MEEESFKGLDDATLIQRTLQGDGRAYEQLIFRHQDEVYAVVLPIVKDERAAKEIRDDAFSKAWEGLSAFRGDAKFSTWVITFAQNLCADYFRTRKKARQRTAMSLDTPVETEKGEVVYPQLPDPTPSVLDNLIRAETEAETQQKVMDALSTLDEETYRWMVLHWIKHKSYPEIETIEGVPEETIKTRCRRAREALGNIPELRRYFEREL